MATLGLCVNLVNVGPVTPEFTKVTDVPRRFFLKNKPFRQIISGPIFTECLLCSRYLIVDY